MDRQIIKDTTDRQTDRQIELVICNNDDMALGAIDAIERNGYLIQTIKVVGIDGTPAGQEALKAGKLFGTVESDRVQYAGAIFELAAGLSMGEKMDAKKYYWSSQKPLTD